MPSRGLVFYEWRKHGICSGLYPDRYFALLRRAALQVKIPPEFATAGRDRRSSPAQIEAAFASANPGLSPNAMAAICGPDGFTELRICMDKDLRYRSCPNVERSACRLPQIAIPGAQ
jgi:ribonuclease T2